MMMIMRVSPSLFAKFSKAFVWAVTKRLSQFLSLDDDDGQTKRRGAKKAAFTCYLFSYNKPGFTQ